MKNVELFNDHFQNFKTKGIPKAQLIIADVPYNLDNKAYASNPSWYVDGDNKNGESDKAGKSFFDTDKDFHRQGRCGYRPVRREWNHFIGSLSIRQESLRVRDKKGFLQESQ